MFFWFIKDNRKVGLYHIKADCAKINKCTIID